MMSSQVSVGRRTTSYEHFSLAQAQANIFLAAATSDNQFYPTPIRRISFRHTLDDFLSHQLTESSKLRELGTSGLHQVIGEALPVQSKHTATVKVLGLSIVENTVHLDVQSRALDKEFDAIVEAVSATSGFTEQPEFYEHSLAIGSIENPQSTDFITLASPSLMHSLNLQRAVVKID